jgi:ParB family chromosome partitioning protein
VLSAGHARAVLALDDPEAQDRLAERIVAEGLSVRAAEEIVAVGSPDPTSRAPRRRKPQAPALAALGERLSDLLETRVTVELGRRRGKLVVEFASIDDLERVVGQIAPEAMNVLRAVGPDGDPPSDASEGDHASHDSGSDPGHHQW